ncbi:MAG: YncE family protein, partial [Acidobacteriota bacterium]
VEISSPTPAMTPGATATPLPPPPATVLFAASEADGTLHVFRNLDDDPIAVIPTVPGAHNLAVSPDGRWIAVSSPPTGEVSIIDSRALTEVARLAIGQRPHDVLFSRDAGSALQVVEVGTWRLVRSIDVGISQHSLAFNADESQLWMTIGLNAYPSERGSVVVLDLATLSVLARIDTGRDAHDIARSPDGREFWITNSGVPSVADNHVTIIDATTRASRQLHLGSYPSHPFKPNREVSPPEAVMPSLVWLTDIGRGALLGVDPARGLVSVKIATPSRSLHHVALDPFGRAYVADSGSDSVIVADLSTGSIVARLPVSRPHGVGLLVDSAVSAHGR